MNYILQKDFNWFGRVIPQGTRYVPHGKDYWWPVLGKDQAHVPTMQVDFMTIRNNEEYFKRESIEVALFEGCFGSAGTAHTYVHTFHTNRPIPEHLRDTIEVIIQKAINL
jgi:hypothetical protein